MMMTRVRSKIERRVAATLTMALLVTGAAALGAGPASAAEDDVRFGVTGSIPFDTYGTDLVQDSSTNSLFGGSSWSRKVTIIDSETLEVRGTLPFAGSASSLAVSEAHQLLYVADHNTGSISALNSETGELAFRISILQPTSMVVDDRLDLLWVYSKESGTLSALNSADGSAAGESLNIGPYANAFDVDPLTGIVYATTRFPAELVQIDEKSREVLRKVKFESPPYDVAVDVATHVAYVSWNWSVTRVDSDPDVPVVEFETGLSGDSLIVDPTSNHLLLADDGDGSLAAMDRDTGTVVLHGAIPKYSSPILSASGERLFVPDIQRDSISVLTKGTPPSITSAGLGGELQHTVPFVSPALVADGPGPISWSMVRGPYGGLSIDADSGVVSGIPERWGAFSFTIRAGNTFGYDDLDIAVRSVEQPLTKPTVGQYRFLMPRVKGGSISGGVTGSTGYPAPTFTATGLPKGVTMNSGGSLNGIPRQIGLFQVKVTATNSSGATTKVLPLRILGTRSSTADIDFGYSRTTLNAQNRKELRALARSIPRSASMENYDVYGLSPNTLHKWKDLKRAKKRAWAMAKYMRHLGVDAKPTYHYNVEREHYKSRSYGWSATAVNYTYK